LGTEKEKYLGAVKREASIANNIERTTSAIAEGESRRQDLERQTCYTCGQSINESQYQKIFCEINEQITRQKEALEHYEKERQDIVVDDTMVNNLEEKLSNLSSRLSEINAVKNQAARLTELKNSIDKAKKESILVSEQLELVEQVKDNLSVYRKLMDANGPIMRSLLTSVSELLTSDTIRVRAHKQLVNKEIRPDFGVDLKVKGHGWVSYDDLSGGQKAISDLTILEKLVKLAGGVGLLIFDETFKSLDNENLETAVDLLKSLQCHSTFIISHEQVFPYWDVTIQTKVDNLGGTVYTTR
jgi:DNA repair exonuclease SbcCD ATPase subunit